MAGNTPLFDPSLLARQSKAAAAHQSQQASKKADSPVGTENPARVAPAAPASQGSTLTQRKVQQRDEAKRSSNAQSKPAHAGGKREGSRREALKRWESEERLRVGQMSGIKKAFHKVSDLSASLWTGEGRLFVIAAIVVISLLYMRVREETFTQKNEARSKRSTDDPYKVLGLFQHNATASDVRKAYRNLSLKLHPDKNPNCKDCVGKFAKVSKAYRALLGRGDKSEIKDDKTDYEEAELEPIPSESTAFTDVNFKDLLASKPIWLIQLFSSESEECWEAAPAWENIYSDHGQTLPMARVDIDNQKVAARHFWPMADLQPPAFLLMLNGQPKFFKGLITPYHLVKFVTQELQSAITVVNDRNINDFMSVHALRVRTMLFAPAGFTKMRLSWRLKAIETPWVAFAEVSPVNGTSVEVQKRFNTTVVGKPSMLVIKEKGAKPLRSTGTMTRVRIDRVLGVHQFTSLPILDHKSLPAACAPATSQPCVLYIRNQATAAYGNSSTLAQFRIASKASTELRRRASLNKPQGRDSPYFGVIDAATQPEIAQSLGIDSNLDDGSSSRIVALRFSDKHFSMYSGLSSEAGRATARDILAWSLDLAIPHNVTDDGEPPKDGKLETKVEWTPVGDSFKIREVKAPFSFRALILRWSSEIISVLIIIIVALLYTVYDTWVIEQRLARKDKQRRDVASQAKKKSTAELSTKAMRMQAVDEENRKRAEQAKEQRLREQAKQAEAKEQRLAEERKMEEASEQAKRAKLESKAAKQAEIPKGPSTSQISKFVASIFDESFAKGPEALASLSKEGVASKVVSKFGRNVDQAFVSSAIDRQVARLTAKLQSM